MPRFHGIVDLSYRDFASALVKVGTYHLEMRQPNTRCHIVVEEGDDIEIYCFAPSGDRVASAGFSYLNLTATRYPDPQGRYVVQLHETLQLWCTHCNPMVLARVSPPLVLPCQLKQPTHETNRPQQLPKPLPINRHVQSDHDGFHGILIHHKMRGDMYAFAAALILDDLFFIRIIQCNDHQGRGRTARHLTWLNSVLTDNLLLNLGQDREDRIAIEAVPVETVQAWNEREPEERRDSPDLEHYQEVVNDQGDGYNFAGTVTHLVGEKFRADPIGAQQKIRQQFVFSLPDLTRAAVDRYIEANLQNILRLSEDDVCMILWCRSPREENERIWSLTPDAIGKLTNLAGYLGPGRNITVFGGDALLNVTQPATDNLVELWTRAPFNADNPADMRVQLCLFDALFRRSRCKFVALGMRSGMLEALALLGIPTLFMELFQAPMGKTQRMRQWQGRIPYFGVYLEDYPIDADLTHRDCARILAQMMEALQVGSAQPLRRLPVPRALVVDRNLVQINEFGRQTSYRIVLEEVPDYGSPFGAFMDVVGEVDGIREASDLREAVAAFVDAYWNPQEDDAQRITADQLASFIRDRAYFDDQDTNLHQAMFHALSCRTGRAIAIYERGNRRAAVPFFSNPVGGQPVRLIYLAAGEDEHTGYWPLLPPDLVVIEEDRQRMLEYF